MSSILASLDFFGVDIRWNYKGSDKQKTMAGLLMTLIFAGLTVWSIVNVAKSLFERENPEVTESILFDSDPFPVEISPEKFSFVLGLTEAITYDHFLDETIYTLKTIYRTQTRVEDEETGEFIPQSVETELNLIPCTLEVLGVNADMFKNLPLSKIYCLDNEQDVDISLEGVFESIQYNVIDVYLFPCVNTTENGNHCQDKDVINQKLEGSSFTMYYSDASMDAENLTEPQLVFRNSMFNMMSPEIYKEIYFYIRNVEITTDTGIIGESLSTEEFVQFEKVFETSAHLQRSNQQMLQFRMKLSQSRVSYQRRYHKITYVLAEITGVLETYIIAMVFIITPIQRFLFYQKFIQDSYMIEEEFLGFKKKQKKIADGDSSQKALEKLSLKKRGTSGEGVKGEQTLGIGNQLGCASETKFDKIKQASNAQQVDYKPERGSVSKSHQDGIEFEKLKSIGADTSLNTSNHPFLLEPENNTSNSPAKHTVLDIKDEKQGEKEYKAGNLSSRVKLPPLKKQNHSAPSKDEGDLWSRCRSKSTNSNPKQAAAKEELKIIEKQDEELGGSFLNIENKEHDKMKSDLSILVPQPVKRESEGDVTNDTADHETTLQRRLNLMKNRYDRSGKADCEITLSEYVLSFFGCAAFSKKYKGKRKMYDVGYQQVETTLDIHHYYVIKKEIQLLKTLLFKEEEMELFDEIIDQKLDISDKMRKKKDDKEKK